MFSGTKQMDSADEDVCICMQLAGGTKEFLCEMDSAAGINERRATRAHTRCVGVSTAWMELR